MYLRNKQSKKFRMFTLVLFLASILVVSLLYKYLSGDNMLLFIFLVLL